MLFILQGVFFKLILMDNNDRVNPFLKWAGGKRWFVNKHAELLNLEYDRYIEPFLGSGAVFFKLQPKKAILADANKELIDTYRSIKEDWEKVVQLLRRHHKLHSKDYYYKIRGSKPKTLFSNAARLIYLNRTCWNGLYRVNRQNRFNVPIGTKTKVILDTDDFEAVSRLLSKVILIDGDFESTINRAKEGDLVFVDPPYTVKHNNNGFINYNESLFSWSDQKRLASCLTEASKRGATVVATNANHDPISELYKVSFKVLTTQRHSVLAANSSDRKVCKELIILSK